MKKVIIVFFALLAMSADAQIDTVLYKTFTDMEAPSSWTKIETNPSGYEGWAFKECFTQATDGGSKIRVGDETTRGSVTLPTLGGLNGNARITMEVRFDDSGKFLVANDNSGTVYGTNQAIGASNWTWITPIPWVSILTRHWQILVESMTLYCVKVIGLLCQSTIIR
jgi:hypothetical protein